MAPAVVQIAMEIAFLCCSRQADILNMRKSQLGEEGILIQQSKTGVAQIKAWGKRPDAAISAAKGLPLKPGMSSIYVIHQPSGQNTHVMDLTADG